MYDTNGCVALCHSVYSNSFNFIILADQATDNPIVYSVCISSSISIKTKTIFLQLSRSFVTFPLIMTGTRTTPSPSPCPDSLRQVSPSGYCEAVVSHLLLPVVEAALALPEEPQKAFLGLAVCVLVNEMRKTITANRRTYR